MPQTAEARDQWVNWPRFLDWAKQCILAPAFQAFIISYNLFFYNWSREMYEEVEEQQASTDRGDEAGLWFVQPLPRGCTFYPWKFFCSTPC